MFDLISSDFKTILKGSSFLGLRSSFCTHPVNSYINFLSCSARTTKGGIDLFIKPKNHKLNHINGRNIRISPQKCVNLSQSKAMASSKKNRTRINMIRVIRSKIPPTCK